MNRVVWRWQERDLGFRFRTGKGKQAAEYYQARTAGDYYIVPVSQRKLAKHRVEELASLSSAPPISRVVPNPWRDYDRGWDWIVTEDDICLNWAGCLDKEEIYRREDEGVQRAMEMVTELVAREEPEPLTVHLIRQVHAELMGAIYPFAGQWRTVALHKGDGPTKWPLPPDGIQPLMDVLERNVLSRSPFIDEDDAQVFTYASEVMNEILAIHPFREGNGRAAFVVGNLLLMQNNMLPLAVYERRADEARYFAACETGRIRKDYAPLAVLLAEWEDRALEHWRELHG
jgi:cell filamentation protein